jgi:hypothetical protein
MTRQSILRFTCRSNCRKVGYPAPRGRVSVNAMLGRLAFSLPRTE